MDHDSATILAVSFRFPGGLAPTARRVSVLGAFNGWKPSSHPLTKTSEGDWVTTIYLSRGRVVYCFDVDGTPWLDPSDDGRIPNGWGSEYSIREVRQRAEESAPGGRTPRELLALQDLQDQETSIHRPPGEAPGGLLECQKETTPDAIILRLAGEVDLVTSPMLFSTLKTLAEDGYNAIVDLSGLQNIDSTGVQALIDANRLFLEREQRLALAGPSAIVRRIIDVIDKVILVFPSSQSAADSFRASGARPAAEINTT
jgi:anti-sigma B factor antagonist